MGKKYIAVHAHAAWAGGVPPAAFSEKMVASGTKKDIRLVYVLKGGLEYKVD